MALIMNLAYPERSQVKYKKTKFPDGQQLIKIESIPIESKVTIKSRLLWDDLQTIICAVAALREIKVKTIELDISYFMGARSDRKFEQGSFNYLKDVICPIINNLNLDVVRVLDPHSDVLEMGVKNFEKLENDQYVNKALYSIGYRGSNDKLVIISPDAGASKKIYSLMKRLNVYVEIVECSKHRSVEGIIEGVFVPKNDFEGKDILIIDDICDGGRTFVELSKALSNRNVGNRYLYITHGIFSNGFDELGFYFNKIFTTNSIRTQPSIIVEVDGDVTSYELVEQFEVI